MALTYADLAERLPEQDKEHVRELAENVLFMRKTLKATRKGLDGQNVVIPYDNGGGQVGIRANPAFGEYQRLLKSYMAALMELRGILAQVAKEDAKAKSEENPLAKILAEAESVIANA